MQNTAEFKRDRTIFLAIIIVFGLLLLYSLREYFTAFLGALMFYVLFKEWMTRLVKLRKFKKGRAALLIVLSSFLIVLIPLFLFFSMIYFKMAPIINQPQVLKDMVHQADSSITEKIGIQLLTADNVKQIESSASKMVSGVLNEGLNFFTSIVMMCFFLYFMLIKFNRMEATVLLSLPFSNSKIKMFGKELKAQTFSNAVGIPLIAIVQGFFAYGVYLVVGLPQAGFWAFLTGFSSVIPIVGTGIIWVPVCIYMFSMGNTWQGITVLLWCAIVMGSMDNVIRFVLAKKMADVHPVVTVLGIILGLKFLGITGLIFGPLIISYFIILMKIYYADYRNVSSKEKPRENVLELGVPFIYTKKIIDTSEDE